MTELCNTFKQLARATWNKINQSRQVNFQLKEETITDLIMLDIKVRHSDQVKTKVFTKTEEGINGSDWEWWFRGLTGNWIGFRVQAKIINIHSNKFEHLHYKSSTTANYQCDKLIENALIGNTPKIPLYCLFIQTNNNSILNNWSCGTYQSERPLYGCSLTSAFNIKRLRASNAKHITDLESDLKPWHCLVCCTGYGNGDFISSISAYAEANFIRRIREIKPADLNIPKTFITQNPPHYVLSIFENENTDNIESPDKELHGIIIMEEKE